MSLGERAKTEFEKRPGLLGLITGACLGFLFFRPYTILVYALFHFVETGSIGLHGRIYVEGPHALRFFMLLTSVSFVLLGGALGLVFGKWYDRRQKHINEQIEREKKEAAIEVLKELNVTLSHYIMNSSTIIRGFAQRGNKKTNDEMIKEYFSIIEEEVDKTIAVMKGLQALKEIETVKYVDSGAVVMIDLKKQIEEQLKKLQALRGSWSYYKEEKER